MKGHFYSFLSRVYPKFYRQRFEKVLLYAADTYGAGYWLGATLLFSGFIFCIFLVYPLVVYRTVSFIFLLYGVIAFAFVHFFVYLIAYFKMEDRRERVERALPDFLQLMAANVRAGMTPFQALRLSARDEFGPLKDEIQYATTRALGTENFSEALLSIRERVHSDIFDRTLELLSSSLKGGGKLSQLLEDLSREVLEIRSLRKELATNTRSYSLFILFTVLIGAPLLLSISLRFLAMISGLQATNPVMEGSLLLGTIGISTDMFVRVAYVFLVFTALFASVLIGVIREGKMFYGLRYAPFLIAGSLVLFLAFRFLLAGILG